LSGAWPLSELRDWNRAARERETYRQNIPRELFWKKSKQFQVETEKQYTKKERKSKRLCTTIDGSILMIVIIRFVGPQSSPRDNWTAMPFNSFYSVSFSPFDVSE
jgi:hypothetical protein